MKNLCIIQARYSSTRLPGKVLKKINGTPLLAYQIKRLKQAKKIDKIIIATSGHPANDKIEQFAKRLKIDCFRGSENDVLDRFYQASLAHPSYSVILRTTADCPLIDPELIDQVVHLFDQKKLDYASNVDPPTYPDGMDIEIFKTKVLHQAAKRARLMSEREHVTPYIKNKMKIKKGNLAAPCDFSHFRLTVDEPIDFKLIKFLITHSTITDSYLHYISLLTKNPKIMLTNMHIIRNAGLIKSLKNDSKIKK